MKLTDIGWSEGVCAESFEKYKQQKLEPGRVSLEHRGSYVVWTGIGEIPGVVSGRMYYEADGRGDLPVVGDWVAAQVLDEADPHAVIHAVLPRFSKISRKEAGSRTIEQPIAANIDTLIIMTGLDNDYNPRRVERYLALAQESGARPVVVLSKADLCDDIEDRIREIEQIVPGAGVHAISAMDGYGIEQIERYFEAGQTVALVGSSGVGKSTITNYLLGNDVIRIQEVRASDNRGRHTTTSRQMYRLPGGGLIIDTPGMRELQLWSDDGIDDAFADIAELARECRFSDCSHNDEPGCAVKRAVESGRLSEGRFENYAKMRKELDYLNQRQEQSAAMVERGKWKGIHKEIKRMKRDGEL